MPASVGAVTVVEVVTRYGGCRHLAASHLGEDRHFTACMGTSSWTIESWRKTPDHPLGLTAEQMAVLPMCSRCVKILRHPSLAPAVYSADSVRQEAEAAGTRCLAQEQNQFCTRAKGHRPDVHIATGAPDITLVWTVSDEGG